MKILHIEGISIAYKVCGHGEPIVFMHCSGASHREWQVFSERMQARFLCVMPDRPGYGFSHSWPEDIEYDEEFDARVLISLAEMFTEPVHVVGHSFGGAVALEVARMRPDLFKTLTLVEPVSFHLLRGSRWQRQRETVDTLSQAVQNLVSSGKLDQAANVFMTFWVGRSRWWLMPKRLKTRIARSMRKVADEFKSMEKMNRLEPNYENLCFPIMLIEGQKTVDVASAVIEQLKNILPIWKYSQIRGAGHMSPFTHPDEIISIIEEFIDFRNLPSTPLSY